MITRFAVTIQVDIDAEKVADYRSVTATVEFADTGVRLLPNKELKITAFRTDMVPGGMTQEEYLSKVHAQIHREHEDPEGGLGGANNLN